MAYHYRVSLFLQSETEASHLPDILIYKRDSSENEMISESIALARRKKEIMKRKFTNLGNVNFVQYHNVRSF